MAAVNVMGEECKIVSNVNGELVLHEKNLDSFIKKVADDEQECPVAILSVIGPTGSGKTFYTNLLINYFRLNGTNRWIETLSENEDGKPRSLTGFVLPNVCSPDQIIPDEICSGIYFWPEPFHVSTENGNIIVWILHVHHVGEDRQQKTASDGLNILLTLLSSRILEINIKEKQDYFLEISNFILSHTSLGVTKDALCDVVQLFREFDAALEGSVMNYFSSYGSSDTIYYCKKQNELHDQRGCLTLDLVSQGHIKKLITLVGSSNNIRRKLNGNVVVTLTNIKSFFQESIFIVNYIWCDEFPMRATIQRLVDVAVQEIKQDMLNRLHFWIEQELNRNSVHQCGRIYVQAFWDFLSTHNSKGWSKLSKSIKSIAYELLREELCQIRRGFEKTKELVFTFKSKLATAVKTNTNIGATEMEKLIESNKTEILFRASEVENELKAYLGKACDKLGKIYKNDFRISRIETKAATSADTGFTVPVKNPKLEGTSCNWEERASKGLAENTRHSLRRYDAYLHGNYLRECLGESKGVFKSYVERGTLHIQVQNCLQLINNPETSEAELKQQKKFFEAVEKAYFLQKK